MNGYRFKLDDHVTKVNGSWWQGRVVGFYQTLSTPFGICVQLDMPNGPVQIYPQNAFVLTEDASK